MDSADDSSPVFGQFDRAHQKRPKMVQLSTHLTTLPVKAQLAGRPLHTEASREMKCSRARGQTAHRHEAGGFVEREARASLAGSRTQNTAAGGGIKGAEPFELDGDLKLAGSCADRASTTTDRFAGQQNLREQLSDSPLPVGFIIAGEIGEVGQGLVDGGVELAEKRHELMADAVSCVDGLGVRGVLAPGLAGFFQESLDLRAADVEKRANDLAGFDANDGVDGAKALGPGSAEKLEEDCLSLIIEGMGGQDRCSLARFQKRFEEGIAEVAGGLFDRLAGLLDAVGDAGVVDVEQDIEACAELLHEGKVSVGIGSAKAVVDMGGGETDAERLAGGVKRKEQGNGVSSARDGGAEAVAGAKVFAIEDEGHSVSS
jgi:hypothetical protein